MCNISAICIVSTPDMDAE